MFGACIVVAFAFSFKLTLVMLATGVPSAVIFWGIGRLVDPAIEAQRRELAQAAKCVTAATTAIDIVKAYNAEDYEAFQFIAAIRRAAKFYSRQVLCNCAQMSYVKLWMIMLFVLGFYFAIVLVDREELTPGTALTTFYAALVAFQALEALGPMWLVLVKGMAAGRSLRGLVREQEEGSQQVDKITGWRRPSRCLGDIKMTNVSIWFSTVRGISTDNRIGQFRVPVQPDSESPEAIHPTVLPRPAHLCCWQERLRKEHIGQPPREILRASGRADHR